MSAKNATIACSMDAITAKKSGAPSTKCKDVSIATPIATIEITIVAIVQAGCWPERACGHSDGARHHQPTSETCRALLPAQIMSGPAWAARSEATALYFASRRARSDNV